MFQVRQGLKKAIYKQGYFLAGFIPTAIIMAIAFAVMGVRPFGTKSALIVDSVHQYLPFYTVFRDKLVSGESVLYSFSGGLGYNFWSTYAYYLASPSNLLLYFVPMANVADFMDVMIVLRTGLCGGCFAWYAHKKVPDSKAIPAAVGMAYGSSGLILGYYFNLMWLDSIAMLPLVMYGIEQLVKGGKGTMFCLSLSYGIWCNYYIGFMLCLFSCLWFLVAWASAQEFRWKPVLKGILCFTWHALLAGGMAAVLLLPAYMGLSSTEAMDSTSFPSVAKFYMGFLEMLDRHLAFSEPLTVSDTQEGLNIYCGMASVFFAILFLLDKKVRLRERAVYAILCAFFYLSFSFNILNYIWHGFHTQNGLPNRFSFLLVGVILTMAARSFGHLRSFGLLRLLVAWLPFSAFCAFRYLTTDSSEGQWRYIAGAALLSAYLAASLAVKFLLKNKKAHALIALMLVAEVSANCIYGVRQNSGEEMERHLADQASYQELLGDGTESFCRSEVDRQWMRNVTMYCGGSGLVMFNSTMYSSVVDFCKNLGIEARTNKNGYYGVTRLMNYLLGIRYVLSPSGGETMYGYQYVDSSGDLSLYENTDALSIGYMVSSDIKDWDSESGDFLQAQDNFVSLATGMDGIYTYDRSISLEDGETYQLKIPEGKQVYFYIDRNIDKLELTTPEYSRTYSNFTNFIFTVNATEEDDIAEFTVELGDGDEGATAYVYTCPDQACSDVAESLAEDQMENVLVEGNCISGTIDTSYSGTLLLTVPYDVGWTVLVDGKETEAYAIGGALTGIDLEKGVHTIEMEYTPPGFWKGLWISFTCAGLFFLTFFIGSSQKKKARTRSCMDCKYAVSDPVDPAANTITMTGISGREEKENLLSKNTEIGGTFDGGT